MYKPYEESLPTVEIPTKTLEPWRKTFLDAADLLEKRGHCKEELCDDRGAVCAIGALNVALTGDPTQTWQFWTNHGWDADRIHGEGSGWGLVNTHRPKGMGARELIAWNNAPERTAEEVIDLFRTVALS